LDARPAGTTCPFALRGPDLVFVPAPIPYCIDAREVTAAQYGEFLAAADAATAYQATQCSWNSSFIPLRYDGGDTLPLGSCPASNAIFDTAAHQDEAIGCVDWCDARAYCAWAGKRLCGVIGPRPQLDQDTLARDPTITEWQYACTNAGTHAYPYGDVYVAGKCADVNSIALLRAGTGSTTCVGSAAPYDEIRDLVGNRFEWTADCDATFDNCLNQGGQYSGPGVTHSCADSGGWAYSHLTNAGIGIRCCADAIAP
jgi:formylglycine-generating enzyme required for sulfatase activity